MGILHTRATSDQRTSRRKRAIAGFTAATLAVGGLSLSPLFTEVAEAATGTIYDTGGWHDGAPEGVYLAVGEHGVKNSTPAPFIPLDSQTLYGATRDDDGVVFTYARGGADPVPNKQVAIGYGHNLGKLTDNEFSTIAVDVDPAGARGAKYAYLWGYDAENDISDTEARNLGITNYNKKLLEGYAPIFRATEGQSNLELLLIPSAKNFEKVKDDDQGWSGGDVNQSTGDIVFSGPYDSLIGADYRMMILNPITFQYTYSGPILPATPEDNIFHNTKGGRGANGYVSSDFALDANGNAYLTITSTEAAPAFGLGAAKRAWLVRVVPSTTGNWTYNLVTPLTAAPGQNKAVTNYVTRDDDIGDYGVAWYNGSLYVTERDNKTLLEINPVSGQVFGVPRNSSVLKSGPVESDVRDLASGQNAIIIEGNVYNDVWGDGSVAGDPTVPGQIVALYSKDASGALTYQGQRTTDASGAYSFLVSGYGDWVVRLVQPTLGSRNAVQTWASAGGIANTTVAKCDSGDLVGVSGPCSGALSSPYRPDPALPAVGTGTPVTDLSFYSTVHVTSSTEVPRADFGITTAGDYGDSPLGPPSAELGAPFHLNSVNPQLWLGSTLGLTPGPSTDDSHLSDDGVTVSSFYGDLPLSGTVLAANHQYNLKAAVSGPKTTQANVRGWVAPGGSWIPTPAWSPTLVGATAVGPFIYQTAGPVAPTGNLRVDASVVPSAAPINPPGSYTVYPGAANWAVPGEVEDYTFNLAQAAYRPAAVTTGPVGAFTVGGQSLTAGPAPVFGAPAATTVGLNAIDVTVPDLSWTVAKAEALSVDTGAVLETLPVTGNGLNYTVSRNFASGDDVVILVTFQYGPRVYAGNSDFTAAPPTQVAGSPIVATVTARDVYGNPVTGLKASQVVVTGVSNTAGVPNSSLEVSNFVEVGNGVYTYYVTSKLVGSFTLSAVVDDVLLIQHPVVTFTAGGVCVTGCTPVDPSHITRVVIDVNDQLANGIAKDTAIAYAYDRYGNAVSGASVLVTDQSTGSLQGWINPTVQTATTGADGIANLSWTSEKAGSFTAESTIDGLRPTIGGVLSGANGIRFTNGAADPTRSTLLVTPAGPLVAGESYTALATIRDVTGNPVAAETVRFTTNSPYATVSSVTCITNAAGQCTVTFSSRLAGVYELSAKVSVGGAQVNISGSPASREFIAGPVCVVGCTPINPANVTRVVVTKNSAEANGYDQDQATVYAYDRFGNPVPGATVATTSTDPSLTRLNPVATTLADGTAVLSYTSTLVGVKFADVTVDAQTPLGSPVALVFGAGAGDPARSWVTIAPLTSQVVDSVFTVTAYVADSTGNSVRDAVVSFSTTAPAALSAQTCITDVAGTCSVALTSAKVGTYPVYATIPNALGVPTGLQGSPVSATFTPGEVCTRADGCIADLGEPLTRVEIIHNGAAHDGVDHDIVKVYAYDKHGNAVPGATVTSTKAPGVDLIIQPNIAPTAADGTTTIWYASNTAGIHLADVRVDSKTPLGSPAALAFGSGLGDPRNSTFSVSPGGPLVVGVDPASTYVATANVKDVFGVPAGGVVVTFGILPGVGPTWVGGSASCITAADGTCSTSVYSTKAGTYTITAALANGAIRVASSSPTNPVYGASRAWRPDEVCSAAAGCNPVDPYLPSELRTRVEVTLDNQLADGNSYDEATLYAFDKWGNPVPGALVKSQTVDPALNIQPGIPGTNDAGQSVIKYSSTVAGAHLATVQVDSKNVPGSPVTLNFRGGSPDPNQSALSVDPTIQEVGLDVTATAIIKDAAGNVVPATVVTFGVTGNATLSSVTAVTDASGQATVTLTDETAETINVTATVQVGGVDTPISGSPTAVTFTPGPICVSPCVPGPNVPNDRRTRVEVTANHALANNVHANTTTTWAFDKYGNAVTGATAHTASPSATLRIPITHKAVLHTGTVDHDYHSYEAGDHNAHVFLDGQEITFVPQPGSALDNPADIALRSSPAKLTFRGGVIDPSNSTLVVDPSTQEVGKDVTVTVTVRDAVDNVIPGVDVTLGTSGNSVLGAITGVTDVNGQVVTTLTDKKAETVYVTATVPVNGVDTPVSGSPAQVIFTAGPLCIHPCVPDPDVPNDRRTRLDVVVDGALADGKATDEVIAWAFDRYGNPVADTIVETTPLDPVLRVKDVTVLTGLDGSARITYAATAGGSHQASVTLNAQPVIFIPQPGSAWDNEKDQAAHSSPATLTFKAVSPKVQTGGSVLSSDQPVKAFKR